MRRPAQIAFGLLFLIFGFLLRSLALYSNTGSVVRHVLAPGVELVQEIIPPPNGPLVINALKVNLKAEGVRVQAALARDVVLTDEPARGREPVGALAMRHGALAAVNTDFFPIGTLYAGDPLGIAVRDGELLSEGMPHRVAMGLTAEGQAVVGTLLSVGRLAAPDGEVASLDGINRPPNGDQIVVLTPAFGAKTQAHPKHWVVLLSDVNLPVQIGKEQMGVVRQIASGDPSGALLEGGAALVGHGQGAEWLRAHLKEGDTVRFRFDFVPNPLPPRGDLPARRSALRGRIAKSVWTEVTQAIGGGPWLVQDGKVFIDGAEEEFSETAFVQARHPRTAVGVTAGGELLLVTVDGRQAFSRGVSLPELAQILLRLGAVQAINLDGGGSTTMFVRDLYVNGPSDGVPRPVASALLIYANAEKDPPDATEIVAEPITLRAGQRLALSLPSVGDALPETGALWGAVGGSLFVDQRGSLFARRAGTEEVIARVGAKRFRFPLTVEPGPPAAVRASFGPVDNNPPDRHNLTIRVTDAYGNPVPNQTVQIRAVGGVVERSTVMTDASGRAVVEVIWDVETGRRAVVTCGNLPPVTATVK